MRLALYVLDTESQTDGGCRRIKRANSAIGGVAHMSVVRALMRVVPTSLSIWNV
jgi:hypothetical protein